MIQQYLKLCGATSLQQFQYYRSMLPSNSCHEACPARIIYRSGVRAGLNQNHGNRRRTSSGKCKHERISSLKVFQTQSLLDLCLVPVLK